MASKLDLTTGIVYLKSGSLSVAGVTSSGRVESTNTTDGSFLAANGAGGGYWIREQGGTARRVLTFDTANVLSISSAENAVEDCIVFTPRNSITARINLFAAPWNGASLFTAQKRSTVNSSAAATLTASAAIPAGAFVVGVTSRIRTAFGVSTGLTSFDMGTAGDPDGFGNDEAITIDATTDNDDWTNGALAAVYPAATDIILTANGGDFDATGQIEITVHYFLPTAASF